MEERSFLKLWGGRTTSEVSLTFVCETKNTIRVQKRKNLKMFGSPRGYTWNIFVFPRIVRLTITFFDDASATATKCDWLEQLGTMTAVLFAPKQNRLSTSDLIMWHPHALYCLLYHASIEFVLMLRLYRVGINSTMVFFIMLNFCMP